MSHIVDLQLALTFDSPINHLLAGVAETFGESEPPTGIRFLFLTRRIRLPFVPTPGLVLTMGNSKDQTMSCQLESIIWIMSKQIFSGVLANESRPMPESQAALVEIVRVMEGFEWKSSRVFFEKESEEP